MLTYYHSVPDIPTFIHSRRGNQLILLAGYKYSVQSSKYCDTPIFIHSRRGNQLILLAGYKYSLKTRNNCGNNTFKMRWRCSTHNARGCRATLLTVDDNIVRYNQKHNHDPVVK
ncbi:hypothetical protein RR48_05197 [Papilio machaon]|uniref:FLYWCH-type domain-containing protein n=1 Tax=Papilio machaon TaxID=76193 RepID=A0A0N1PJ30_PAPMA|nr:hypothetical protein RR48_05197 [Papilio machaon]